MTIVHDSISPFSRSTAQGIYRIVHRATDRWYIGSAVNFAARIQLHLRRLRAGRHHSPKLQAAWTMYGEDAFAFELIEAVPDRDLLKAREQFYLDTLKPHFNIALSVTAPMLGRKQSARFAAVQAARPHPSPSPELRARISATLTGRKKGPVPLERRQRIAATLKGHTASAETRAKISANRKGFTHTEEAKARIRASSIERARFFVPALAGEDNPQAKLSWSTVRTIRSRYRPGVVTLKQLAHEYGVDGTTISLIVRGKIWKEAMLCSD